MNIKHDDALPIAPGDALCSSHDLTQALLDGRHLLWFRPLSPLNYQLPFCITQFDWAGTSHIPIDTLEANTFNEADFQVLTSAQVWLLTSPTAAYCTAQWVKYAQASSPQLHSPHLAVVGQSSYTAWHLAGGFKPEKLHVSTSTDSMGLLQALQVYSHICLVRAESGREDLSTALRERGVQVSSVAVYRKYANEDMSAQLRQCLSIHPKVALLFTSTDQVSRVMKAAGSTLNLDETLIVATYPRIAKTAHQLGFKKVHLLTAMQT